MILSSKKEETKAKRIYEELMMKYQIHKE